MRQRLSGFFKTLLATAATVDSFGTISSKRSRREKQMKFGYAILYVEDVLVTLDFYERAFGLSRRFLHEAGDYGELDTGATTLAFASFAMLRGLGKNPSPPRADAPTSEIALITDDVVAALARALAAGAIPVQDAKTMPWGQTIAYVTDVNGFLVEICTSMT